MRFLETDKYRSFDKTTGLVNASKAANYTIKLRYGLHITSD